MTRTNLVQSAGGIVYYIDKNTHQPKFLLIKRFALSKKIEWVAPKGKIQDGESSEKAALRETCEETGLSNDNLHLIDKVGTLSLSLYNEQRGGLEKDITYYLIMYDGKNNSVSVNNVEGYLGFYKWATIQEIISLVYYEDFRELIRNAYNMIVKK